MSQIQKFRGARQLSIVDERNGMAIYAQGVEASAVAAQMTERQAPSRKWNRFVSAWISCSCALLIVAVLIPTLLAVIGFHGHFLLGPAQFSLVDVQNGAQVSSFTLNPFPAIAGGLVFALLRMWLDHIGLSRR